ncbi:MAG: LuxR C-terminal-related transcriptional regulator [Dermatophilaceae bacterium]
MSTLDDVAHRPVTLLVAPAGAGKTASVAAWCHAHPAVRVSWVRSGAGLTRRSLAATLAAAAGRSMTPRGDVVEFVAGGRAQAVVVVDDAHLMPSAAVRLVDEMMRRAPEALRLVLLCRWDPPLRKLGPTLRGQLHVLHGDVLRLSDDESRQLVRSHAPGLADELVETIVEQSRGWAAVVALAARRVGMSQHPHDAATRLADHGTGVADLLANEVFTTLGDRTRHLLLCLADEEAVDAATAVALTADARAGELLAELSESGLLVTRENGPRTAGANGGAVYRLHPLLTQVLRRRLQQGGVAVAQARACVRKAALSDLAQGNVPGAFRRLVRAQAWADAVDVMAGRGDQLIMKVPSTDIRAVVQLAPDVLHAAPAAWVAVALDRWVDADPNEAAHWIRQVLAQPAESAISPVDLALLRLLAVRIGGDSPAVVVAEARRVVEDGQLAGAAPALSAWLLLELGVAEAWLGDLARSEAHLRWAASVAEPVSRQLLSATLSQLAQTEYLLGNHQDADLLATRTLDELPATAAMTAVATRAHVVKDLVSASPGAAGDLDQLAATAFPPALDDPLTRVLRTICAGRRLRLSDVDAAGDSWLELPPGLPPAPAHVRARLVLERCLPAVIRSDLPAILALREELEHLDAGAEMTLLDAALADLSGGVSEAAAELERAATSALPHRLAHTWAITAVYRAGLLDALGDPEQALTVLHDTAMACAAQRVVRPFYWPSVNGTPTSILLGRLRDRVPSPWLGELQQAVAAWEAVSGRYGGPRRRTWHSRAGVVIPPLTRRERDVLGELARGSTYADVAHTLFVTENTVKTHVSAAYAKLGVTRRSEALKVARTLGLV